MKWLILKQSDPLRWWIVLLCCGLLSNCSAIYPRTQYTNTYHRGCAPLKVWHACPTVSRTGLPGTLHPDMPRFHSIRVEGPYNVVLESNRGRHDVMVHGDASVIGRTHVDVKKGVLRILAEKGVAYDNVNRANVAIRMNATNNIQFDSPGFLRANGLRATDLTVAASHKAVVELKGQVRNLNVATYEQARVDATSLAVRKTLSAASVGESRVYHNQQTGHRNAYPMPKGAVVRMGGLSLASICKQPPCVPPPHRGPSYGSFEDDHDNVVSD